MDRGRNIQRDQLPIQCLRLAAFLESVPQRADGCSGLRPRAEHAEGLQSGGAKVQGWQGQGMESVILPDAWKFDDKVADSMVFSPFCAGVNVWFRSLRVNFPEILTVGFVS